MSDLYPVYMDIGGVRTKCTAYMDIDGVRTLISSAEPIGEPVVYLYGTEVLPPLPEWDKETYPYAILCHSPLTSHFTFAVAEKPFIYNGAYKSGFTSPSTGMKYSIYRPNLATTSTWGDATISEGETVLSYNQRFWANHDIYLADGTLSTSASSEPVPLYVGDEVGVEESVTTVANTDGTAYVSEDIYFGGNGMASRIIDGGTYKFAVGNEAITIENITAESVDEIPVVGNAYLMGTGEAEDDGTDWCIDMVSALRFKLYTRLSGTYDVKAKLVIKDPLFAT